MWQISLQNFWVRIDTSLIIYSI
uniref:Uncharacterized protein n=1 Tax=Heterorhabditis bacteriophora TaxID=37862 RepID=A0A1I7W9F0_HETBA